MSKEDLIPLNKRTKGEQKEIAKKGGIASGVARRNKKNLREATETLLAMPLKGGRKATSVESLKSLEQVSKANPDVATLIIAKQIQLALKGNTRSVELLTKILALDDNDKLQSQEEITETTFIDDLEEQLNERIIEGVEVYETDNHRKA